MLWEFCQEAERKETNGVFFCLLLTVLMKVTGKRIYVFDSIYTYDWIYSYITVFALIPRSS